VRNIRKNAEHHLFRPVREESAAHPFFARLIH